MFMATNFDRVVTYNKERPLKKLHAPSITFSCDKLKPLKAKCAFNHVALR